VGVRHTETNLIIWSQATSSAGNQSVAAERHANVEIAPLLGADRLYDAGDKGCAAGPMDEIAALMRKMQSGQTLEIRATDPSVALDLGAWCRMTGNTLIEQRDDRYLVKKE
jgi:TusA-related sulfurtransferase